MATSTHRNFQRLLACESQCVSNIVLAHAPCNQFWMLVGLGVVAGHCSDAVVLGLAGNNKCSFEVSPQLA